ncbi:g2031 [Coccomyxa elongata]
MLEYVQRTLDYVQQELVPVGYLLSGVAVGVTVGLGNAVVAMLPEQVPKMYHDLVKRSKTMALDAKKEAESALNSVMGSVEKITNDFLNKSKAVKEDGKKKTNETVSNIHANGHAVAAG